MTKDTVHVAYVVVCWNNRKIIDECLQSIKNQEGVKKSIYVIDNASSDGSANYIADKYPDVNLTRSNDNSGFARGNNILINKCLEEKSVEHIALINSDAVIDKDWTQEIVKGLSGKKRVACAQGTTLDYYDHQIVDSLHIYLRDNFQSVQYGYTDLYQGKYSHTRRIFGTNAAAAMYSREFIEDQPNNVLFDEKFYMYLEDVDVAFRSVMSGWNNFYIPKAKAYHMGSVSSKKRSSGYNIEMTFRNQSALLFKNIPLRVFIKFLPRALRFEVHFYRHIKRTEGVDVMRMAIKGRIRGVLRLPLYIADRRRLTKKRRIDNATLERVMENEGVFI